MAMSSARIPLAKQGELDVKVELVGDDDAGRASVERFIQAVFRSAYQAKIRHFLPYLLAMQQNGKTLAALGIRPAQANNLFLETYLDRPVENAIAHNLAKPIDRARVVEVGNLASSHGGGARALMVILTAYLFGAGYDYAVFTATAQVRNNFAKLGIELTWLADANKQCLGEAQHDWGSYYEQIPQVVVGNIATGAANVRQAIVNEQLFPTAAQVWNEAYLAGKQGYLSVAPCYIEADAQSALFA